MTGSEPALPARVTTTGFATTASTRDPARSAASRRPPVSLRVAFRAVTRHWWHILAIWAVATAALGLVIRAKIKPSYEAVSLLRVEPTPRDLFGTGLSAAENFEVYLETQVQLISSPKVLASALANPQVAALPSIKATGGAGAGLGKLVNVQVLPRSYMIQVSMKSPVAAEAATVVNAVVDAYLDMASEWADGAAQAHISNLQAYYERLREQAEGQQKAWLALADKGNVDPPADPGGGQAVDRAPRSTKSSITLDQYKRAKDQLFKVSVDLIEVESLLRVRRESAACEDSARRLEALVQDALHADPDFKALLATLQKARTQVGEARRLARKNSDPAVTGGLKLVEALTTRLHQLRTSKEKALRERLQYGGDDANQAIREASARVESLRLSKARLEEMLEKIEISNRQEGSDAVRVALIRESLEGLREMQVAVLKRLEQLRFEARSSARISRLSEAKSADRPVSDNRIKLMLAAPAGLLIALLGVFFVLEVRADRVSDPDELSARARVEVLGTVPSLPKASTLQGQHGLHGRGDRIQELIQCLDHLRLTLGRTQDAGGGRCFLVTSAEGGEGKTTLATHLAVRSAQAGESTLLIDADLRRSVTSALLHLDGLPGLADILRGETTVEAALICLDSASGLHVLPAGTPDPDPGQVLEGPGLKTLLARLRQTFDTIIIDSPPILPVPDALVLGRWVDGVVLAVRHDCSRFPQVERAHRRLASARIPVLGMVVNGLRPTKSTYFKYARRYEPPRVPEVGEGSASEHGRPRGEVNET